ncbi:hypothetical protein TKK_0014141 [Trichogramma kaykai]
MQKGLHRFTEFFSAPGLLSKFNAKSCFLLVAVLMLSELCSPAFGVELGQETWSREEFREAMKTFLHGGGLGLNRGLEGRPIHTY